MERVSLAELGLDTRIVEAAKRNHNWTFATDVQKKCIPLFLERKNILLRAPTGTGKTAGYVLPMLHVLLSEFDAEAEGRVKEGKRNPRALVLLPTVGLVAQTASVCGRLTRSVSEEITISTLHAKESTDTQRLKLNPPPVVLISSPFALLKQLKAQVASLSGITVVILDEADLLTTYGYRDEIVELLKSIPQNAQIVMVSATLDAKLGSLQSACLSNYESIEIGSAHEEESTIPTTIVHSFIRTPSVDNKLLAIYGMFAMRKLSGKVIFFLNEIEDCFRLLLFLRKFKLQCLLLNADLPVMYHQNVVEVFNKGICDILIIPEPKNTQVGTGAHKGEGLARGVDYKGVNFVVNVDLPRTSQDYIHRVGRTGRANRRGTAISFVTTDIEMNRLRELEEEVKVKISRYDLPFTQLEGFRYRVEDILSGISRATVQRARLDQLREEMRKSEKLADYFAKNPGDFKAVAGQQGAVDPNEESQVPLYLLPGTSGHAEEAVQKMRALKNKRRPWKKTGTTRAKNHKRSKYARRRADPLRTFKSKKPV